VEEPVEVEDGRAVLDAGQLGLRHTDPTGDDLLRQGLAAVVGVLAVGADDLAHVAGGQSMTEGGVVPEVSRHVGGLGDAVAFGEVARSTATAGVVAGETDATTTAVAEPNVRHDRDLTGKSVRYTSPE
jgi:hypothetical protein